ncbi:MAG: hypothetical protein HY791_10710 [Deltaproteobacteria bacterium]|nr:hypothetical protein [Deltaproteobacteria bacterium]
MKALVAIVLLAAAGYYFFTSQSAAPPSNPANPGQATTSQQRMEGVKTIPLG